MNQYKDIQFPSANTNLPFNTRPSAKKRIMIHTLIFSSLTMLHQYGLNCDKYDKYDKLTKFLTALPKKLFLGFILAFPYFCINEYSFNILYNLDIKKPSYFITNLMSSICLSPFVYLYYKYQKNQKLIMKTQKTMLILCLFGLSCDTIIYINRSQYFLNLNSEKDRLPIYLPNDVLTAYFSAFAKQKFNL